MATPEVENLLYWMQHASDFGPKELQALEDVEGGRQPGPPLRFHTAFLIAMGCLDYPMTKTGPQGNLQMTEKGRDCLEFLRL